MIEKEKLKRWKWVVNIENEPKLKILVEYNTKTARIELIGQYKYNIWVDFVERDFEYTKDEEYILRYIQDTIIDLKIAIRNATKLDEIFENIELIEFKED